MQGKKKLNRKDFLFEDGWFETKVKKPKELVMQQFQISDCQECNIFLFDSNACVYVDSCKYCNIFIGPSQSSIFIRDCESINVVSISQQFRVRDSFNCKFAIFCESQPIIESSHSITFSCYPKQFTYQALQQQMRVAKLNPWNNNWFDIYDFTPNKFNRKNYQLSSYQKEFIILKEIFMNEIKQNQIESCINPVIPSIQGKINMQSLQTYPIDEITFLVLNPLIEPQQVCSLILQSRLVPVLPEIQEILSLKSERNQKLLFLKIKKSEQSRWKLNSNVLKFIKTQKQKQTIESTVFAPFKDQH